MVNFKLKSLHKCPKVFQKLLQIKWADGSNEQVQDKSDVIEELFKFNAEFNHITTSDDNNNNSNLDDYDVNSNHYQQLEQEITAQKVASELGLQSIDVENKVEQQASIDEGETGYDEFASILQEKSQCSHSEIDGNPTSLPSCCIHPNNPRGAALSKRLKHPSKRINFGTVTQDDHNFAIEYGGRFCAIYHRIALQRVVSELHVQWTDGEDIVAVIIDDEHIRNSHFASMSHEKSQCSHTEIDGI